MKKLILAAVLATTPALAQADDVFGIWKTIPDDNGYYGHIEMKVRYGKYLCTSCMADSVLGMRNVRSMNRGVWSEDDTP